MTFINDRELLHYNNMLKQIVRQTPSGLIYYTKPGSYLFFALLCVRLKNRLFSYSLNTNRLFVLTKKIQHKSATFIRF